MKKYCISQNNLKDKDKEEDVFIGPKEFVLYTIKRQADLSAPKMLRWWIWCCQLWLYM